MSNSSTTQTQNMPFGGAITATYYDWAEAGRVPGLDWADRIGHWGLRIPLAGILLYNGLTKFPDAFIAPGAYGVPAILFILTAFGEILAPIALVLAGMIETWRPARGDLRLAGDVMTRLAGFAGAAILLGIIFMLFGGAVYHDPHWLMFGVSVWFMLRGNSYSDLK